MKHYLYSQDQEKNVTTFDGYNCDTIKKGIINHLKGNPTDVIEHCKDFTEAEAKTFAGKDVLNVYQTNPNNGKVSLVIFKGTKELYKNIEN